MKQKEVIEFLRNNRMVILIVGVLGLVAVSIIIGIALWFKPLSVEPDTQAQPPTPVTTFSVMSLEPAHGPVGTPVMVQGRGWPAGQTIGFYLTWPAKGDLLGNTFANAIADDTGQFTTTLVIPLLPLPAGQDTLIVVAQVQDGGPSANALFSLDSALEPPTATVTATPEGQPDHTPQVTASTEVNVRSGPGTAYPLLGLLRANQTAPILGISPDGRWWLISFPGAVEGRGWVTADYVTARNTGNIPVVQPAPSPTATIPTLTATPSPTSTPTSSPTLTPTPTSSPTLTPTSSPTPTPTKPTATATSTPTGTATPTVTGTATATPTATPFPTVCPQATPEPLWVDPVLSPTDQLTQTIRVYLGAGEIVTVTTESGAFTVSGNFDAMRNPALVDITLLPDTTHKLTVTGQVKADMINDCPFGGYTLSTEVDRNGQPLVIVQQTAN